MAVNKDGEEIINCECCIRTTSDEYGRLQTAEKYFSETPCGDILCDWCREVHVMNCETCQEEDKGG